MASSEVHNVVVTGASGVLGPLTVSHLLDAGFTVTAISRDPEAAKGKLPPGVQVIKGDYTSASTLTPSLQAGSNEKLFDAMVCLIDRQQTDAQKAVTDATIAAGIPHLIPSCFGLGERHLTRFKHFPPIAAKYEVMQDILAKCDAGQLTHTTIHCGALLDWALDWNVMLNFKPGGPTMLFDGGDVPMSATLIDTVAKAIATALLKKLQTVNKTLQIQGAVVTQKQLLAWAKEAAPDREFPTVVVDTVKAVEEGWESYNCGDRSHATWVKFLGRANTAEALMDPIDNEVLDVHIMSEEEIRQEVVKRLK